MTREEILEKSRTDNNGKDFFDLQVQEKAVRIAYLCSFIFCALITGLRLAETGSFKADSWLIFFTMATIVFFVKFRMMKKRHELFVFLGYLILTILLAVHFVLDITGRL